MALTKSREPAITRSCITHDCVYLRPVIAHGVGKDIAIVVEGTGGDWLVHGFRGLELCTSIFIPETELTITSHCRQCAVHWMKCNTVDLQKRES